MTKSAVQDSTLSPGWIRCAYNSEKKTNQKYKYTMKQDIKNKELQERQTYVPASVKIIEITVQRIICTSTPLNGTEPYEREFWD